MDQSIEQILNGPDYFYCEKYHARMKKVLCVEKQAGPQAGFDIDYANSMCKECAQGIEIKGEVKGLDIKQIRRERRAFAYKHIKKAKGTGHKVQDKIDFVGANDHLPIDEHIRSGGQGMSDKCLVKDCEKEGKHRGLCSAHIQRYRKGTLPGVELLPSMRGKGSKKDRLDKIKKSAEKINARNSKIKSQKEEAPTVKTRKKAVFADDNRKIFGAMVEVDEPVSSDIIPSPALNVEKMEERNIEDIKIFARAFMAGLENRLISAMTERISADSGQA